MNCVDKPRQPSQDLGCLRSGRLLNVIPTDCNNTASCNVTLNNNITPRACLPNMLSAGEPVRSLWSSDRRAQPPAGCQKQACQHCTCRRSATSSCWQSLVTERSLRVVDQVLVEVDLSAHMPHYIMPVCSLMCLCVTACFSPDARWAPARSIGPGMVFKAHDANATGVDSAFIGI